VVKSIIYQDHLSLDLVIKLLSQQHDQQTVIELTRHYCLKTSSEDIKKKGMEFLYTNGLYRDLEVLIHKNMASQFSSTREWAAPYQLMIDYHYRRYPHPQLLQKTNNFYTEEPALQCVLEFIKISIYYDLHEFERIGDFLAKQHYLFDKIEDRYLVASFRLRLYEYLFIYYWMRNELIMARKYAFRVLNQTTNMTTKAHLHTKLGLSYTFDTFDQGMYHLRKARDIAQNYQLSILHLIEQKHIPFLAAHFKKTHKIETYNKREQAHLEIAKGNFRKACEILKNVPMSDPFALYYLGLAKEDEQILLRSYNCFIEKRSDYFFGRLPLNALRSKKI